MKILDRLPFGDRPHVVTVGRDTVDVYRNQIIVWVSIGDPLRPFPAIVDTGHGHNFSISRRQLDRWSGAALERIGESEVARKTVVQYAADMRIHRNIPGSGELDGTNHHLEIPQGISVLDDEDAPRLPLVGLRTIVANRLKLVINGDRRQVTLKTKAWF